MRTIFQSAALSLLPAFILGFGFNLLISAFCGMKNLADTSLSWTFVGMAIFVLLLSHRNNGQNIFGRFLKYAAIECWMSPLSIIVYTFVSASQANQTSGNIGVAGAGIAGLFLLIVFAIVGGITGLILYIFSVVISKNRITQSNSFENHIKNKITLGYTPTETLKKPTVSEIKTGNKIIMLSIGFISVCIVLSMIHKNGSAGNNKKNQEISLLKSYELSDAEMAVLDNILKDDAQSFVDGKDSLMSNEIINENISTIEKSYEQNRLAADNKYAKKFINLKVKVIEIDSLGNQPYLSLENHSIIPTLAFFKQDYSSKLMNLKRGDNVSLVCEGAGIVLSALQFRNCELSKDFAIHKIDEIKSRIISFLHGNPVSENVQQLVVFSLLAERALPVSSSCFSDEKNCLSDIKKLNNDIVFGKLNDVLDELKGAGVPITIKSKT